MKVNLSQKLALKLAPNNNYSTEELVDISWIEFKLFISNWKIFDWYFPMLKPKNGLVFYFPSAKAWKYESKSQSKGQPKGQGCPFFLHHIYTYTHIHHIHTTYTTYTYTYIQHIQHIHTHIIYTHIHYIQSYKQIWKHFFLLNMCQFCTRICLWLPYGNHPYLRNYTRSINQSIN